MFLKSPCAHTPAGTWVTTQTRLQGPEALPVRPAPRPTLCGAGVQLPWQPRGQRQTRRPGNISYERISRTVKESKPQRVPRGAAGSRAPGAFPARLTWRAGSRGRAGSASPRPGIQAQTWSWKFSPRIFLRCSAYIHLGGRAGRREREAEMGEARQRDLEPP